LAWLVAVIESWALVETPGTDVLYSSYLSSI